MRKIVVLAAGVVMAAMLSAIVLAGQNNVAPVVRQQAAQPKSMADQATTSSQTAPVTTGLSKHNKMMIEQAEQRKLRQVEIDAEQAADPQSK
jgi:lipopolysaccharide export LptBFGC system permease protein LptF